jgi:hypothetical protein
VEPQFDSINEAIDWWRKKLEPLDFNEIVKEYVGKFKQSPLPVSPPAKTNLIERFLGNLQAEMQRTERAD